MWTAPYSASNTHESHHRHVLGLSLYIYIACMLSASIYIWDGHVTGLSLRQQPAIPVVLQCELLPIVQAIHTVTRCVTMWTDSNNTSATSHTVICTLARVGYTLASSIVSFQTPGESRYMWRSHFEGSRTVHVWCTCSHVPLIGQSVAPGSEPPDPLLTGRVGNETTGE